MTDKLQETSRTDRHVWFEDVRKTYVVYSEVCREIERELNAKAAEVEKLKEVMVAAAEEISEHWDAHCNSEGYGPANLMYRLENGISTSYPGYSAGEFMRLRAELEKKP